MSGTQDGNFAVQNSYSQTAEKELAQQAQSGIEHEENGAAEKDEKALSPSQKMDELIRGSRPKNLKREVEKLRKETAKFRNLTREEASQKEALAAKAAQIEQELEQLRKSNRNLQIMRELDKAGCLKSDLVARDIPNDCENISEFIQKYKADNGFLFQVKKNSRGGAFKPSTTTNLTPSQQMDAAIRKALGR